MTKLQRPDIARDLLDRAAAARLHHSKVARGHLSPPEIVAARHQDHANAGVLRRIAAEHDWPGRRLVGGDGAQAAYQIALYADHEPDFQNAMLRLLAAAVKDGQAPAGQWAHLHDRWCINTGQAQLHGTQFGRGPGGMEVVPVRELQHLDTHRARAGLPPHAAAAEAVRRRHLPTRDGESPQAGLPDMVLVKRAA
ncbi:DUF6624 domain-containing protein [Streptomyces fildesensis]|uniref:DUF6624 domain-containing protein n=1 Tax=Streptomyces fildesensis TaxID=375757 RepID=UPI0018DFCB72|nr:DUF6624 domain-containing protein [Streptomyces fildesensis]